MVSAGTSCRAADGVVACVPALGGAGSPIGSSARQRLTSNLGPLTTIVTGPSPATGHAIVTPSSARA